MANKAIDEEVLFNFLNELHPLNAEIIALGKERTFKIAVKKNQVLNCPVEDHGECVFLILKGLVRGFIVDEGKEITSYIAGENQMVGTIRNHIALKLTYEEKFQSLEDSELLVLPYHFIDELYSQHPEINILVRKILAIQYHLSQERSIFSRIPSAEARYKQFLISHPNLKFRVPVKFLASYLGMRIETLSRLRKKAKAGGFN